jgi:aminoglycoside phosphotransferase family enzyme
MPELPQLIQDLLDPKAYLDPPPKVELVQTQISYVLIAGDYVYKIKKPVNMGFLDYSTPAKRNLLCQKEVQLNSRLCPDAYLGVYAITKENGHYIMGGRGKIEEYAVHMRRLPQDAMMSVLLKQDKVTPEMVGQVADILVKFHNQAATNEEITKTGGIDAVIQNTSENFSTPSSRRKLTATSKPIPRNSLKTTLPCSLSAWRQVKCGTVMATSTLNTFVFVIPSAFTTASNSSTG